MRALPSAGRWAIVGLLLTSAMAGAQSPSIPRDEVGAPGEGRPALRPERVALEVFGGTYAGLAGYFVGRGVGTIATRLMQNEDERMRDRIVHGTGLVGGAFAIGGAVYAIGDIGSETGSFPATMLGVGLGAAASELLSRAVFHHRRTPADKGSAKRKWLAATLESALPAIGGTIAFNSSRKWQR